MLKKRWVVTMVLVAGCEGTAEQPVAEGPGSKVTAVVLTTKNAADESTAFAVVERLAALAVPSPDHATLWGPVLEDQLGEPPGPAVTACGANLGCIGGLGRKVGADEVVFGRVTPVKAGLNIQVLVLETDTEKLVRRVEIHFESLLDMDAQLKANFTKILGIPLVDAPDDEAPEELEATGKVVARAGPTRGAVRVRPAATLTWARLREGRKLRVGDLIETGRGSTTVIKYVSGAEVAVAPSSVVSIEEKGEGEDGAERLSIQSGTVRGVIDEGQRKVAVRAPDGEYVALAPETGSGKLAYRVGVRKDAALEVAVKEGRARVRSSAGETAVAAGSAQDIKRGKFVGETFELPDFPSLASPGVDAAVMFRDDLEVKLVWNGVPKARGYHLQVADDQSFRELRLNEYLGSTNWRFSAPRDGTYYWRVATTGEGGRESEFGFSRRLFVTPEKIPDLLVSPKDGAVLTFRAFEPRFVNFAWRAAVPPAPYVLIVSEEPDLAKNPTMTHTTSAQKTTTRELPAGQYFWGVFVNRGGKRKPIFKRPRRLTIEQPSG